MPNRKHIILIGLLGISIFNQANAGFLPEVNFQSIQNNMCQNYKYWIGAGSCLAIGAGFFIYSKHISDQTLLKLKSEQLQKQYTELSAIKDTFITQMYDWIPNRRRLLNIPNFGSKSNENNNVQNLFEQNQIVLANDGCMHQQTTWVNEDWDQAVKVLKKRTNETRQEDAEFTKVNLDDLQDLLKNAKSILNAFLGSDELASFKKRFIQKEGINRIFTYAKLERVIQEKGLSHIHLPLKFLLIFDKKNKVYIQYQESVKLIDQLIKIIITSPKNLKVYIEDQINDYFDFHIFAEIQTNNRNKVKLNSDAFNELKELIRQAPIDVGADNIFIAPNGDAIIIDTEFKGEPADTSIEKLDRYS